MYHNRKYFYKYVTAKTALLILRTRKLKYSSPVTFNDPFDVQTRVDYGFELSDMMGAYKDEMYKLIYGDIEPTGDTTDRHFREIQLLRKIAKEKSIKPPKYVFKKETGASDNETVERAKQNVENLNSWWKKFVRASRVFCVTEEYDNLLMWAHYAKDHTGVVIKFECSRELDTPLCIARSVNYIETPPVIATLDEYIPYITGQDKIKVNHDLLIYKLFQSKSTQWKYEKEWRVFKPPIHMENPIIRRDSDGNEILYDLEPFYPQEIHSIYFGCKIDDAERQKIEKELVGDFGHVNKYLCLRNEKEYKLDFKLIR